MSSAPPSVQRKRTRHCRLMRMEWVPSRSPWRASRRRERGTRRSLSWFAETTRNRAASARIRRSGGRRRSGSPLKIAAVRLSLNKGMFCMVSLWVTGGNVQEGRDAQPIRWRTRGTEPSGAMVAWASRWRKRNPVPLSPSGIAGQSDQELSSRSTVWVAGSLASAMRVRVARWLRTSSMSSCFAGCRSQVDSARLEVSGRSASARVFANSWKSWSMSSGCASGSGPQDAARTVFVSSRSPGSVECAMKNSSAS